MFNLQTFMGHVRTANPNYERILRSDLHRLVELVTNPFSKASHIVEEMAKLPGAAKLKYNTALNYLANNMPGNLPVSAVTLSAVPVNFKMDLYQYEVKESTYAGYDLNNPSQAPQMITGFHKYFYRFKATWKSSDGNLGSLASVYTREKVKYRQNPALPPFNYLYGNVITQYPTLSFTQPAQGNPANGGFCIDDHSNNDPALLACNPRQPGVMTIDQSYQYCVSTPNRGQESHWLDIPNAQFILEREVRRDGNQWTFIFRKRNAPSNRVHFHWEKKIPMAQTPQLLPRTLTDITSGF